MTCFLFGHARAIYTRDSGKNTGRKYGLAARNARKPLEITNKQFQQILTIYAKGKKDTTQDKKATTQDEKDNLGTKQSHSGQKGRKGNFFGSFFSGRSLARALSRGATVHHFRFLWIMNLSRYE